MRLTGVELFDRVLGGVSPGLPLIVSGAMGSGRTALSLELAVAALRRGERVVYLTADLGPVLIQQASSLQFDLKTAMRSHQLVLLGLVPEAGKTARVHGVEPMMEAIREEGPSATLLVVDPLTALVSEILDEVPLRNAVEAILRGYGREDQLIVATADAERMRDQPSLERIFGDLCGALVVIDRDQDGARYLSVLKSRVGNATPGRVEFWLGPGGSVLVPREVSESREPTPVSIAAPPEAAVPAVAVPQAAPPEPDGRRRILLIEPEGPDRDRYESWLSGSYDVMIADDGFDALSAVLRERPQLVVLNLEVSGVSGLEVLRAFQRSGLSIPILAISSQLRRVADRLRPLVLGAADVSAPPAAQYELMHRIDTLMRLDPADERKEPSEGEELLFLDPSNSKILDDQGFKVRVRHAWRFGQRFGIASALVAIETDSEEDLEILIHAADATLRTEDAILQTSDQRALFLMVTAEIESAQMVMGRIEKRAAKQAKRRKLQFYCWPSALSAASISGEWDKYFHSREPMSCGGDS